MERCEEEVLMLNQEIKRTKHTLIFLSNVWASKAKSELSKPGYSAFAYERADMYDRMAKHCRDSYAKFKFEGPGDGNTAPSTGTSTLKQLYLI